jgi:hypothetical protein
MKRTAGAFMLLASLGGGCISAQRGTDAAGHFNRVGYAKEIPQAVGPHGMPVPVGHDGLAKMGNAKVGSGIMQAGYTANPNQGNGVMQAGLFGNKGKQEGCVNCGDGASGGMGGYGAGGSSNGNLYGPVTAGAPPIYHGGHGIVPAPGMGPAGAVAAIGAMPASGMMSPLNSRTSIRFSEPAGMKISWFGPGGISDTALEAPARYNFAQGGIYRLKINNIANKPGLELYPTLEVLPGTPKTATYLAHSSVPVVFTEEDFEQVASGNFLVKVVYLPDPQFQDISTVAGPNEIVSSRLEPGVDPVQEAQRRGTILLIIRLGNIDLQAPNSPAMDAPNPFAQGGPVMPRPVMPGIAGMVPGGAMPIPTTTEAPVSDVKAKPATPAAPTSSPKTLPPVSTPTSAAPLKSSTTSPVSTTPAATSSSTLRR